jgi:hypothetical protein
MSDETDKPVERDLTVDLATNRRRMLQLGVLGASAVVTIRPALAQTAASVMNCQIPIPDQAHASQFIAPNGDVVPAGTSGAFPPPPRPVTGEEAKLMIRGQTPPGFDPNATQAYTSYIRRLQQGVSGFTCYASIQMPRP